MTRIRPPLPAPLLLGLLLGAAIMLLLGVLAKLVGLSSGFYGFQP